jgi:putative endonuclease
LATGGVSILTNSGKIGEVFAARFLAEKGYKIIGANFRTRFGEIDIIAENGKYIIFVEVKTRNANSIASPKESVDSRKQAKIIKATGQYLALYQPTLQPRFDVVEVITEGTEIPKLKEIHHLENAFMASNYL